MASQRDDDWVVLPTRHDDGGFSGGTMERPALKQLLADIEVGGVDCVLVYKVDRLSRSLIDFARMVALFENHTVAFVSVTQRFDTTSSMGRLTLNVLLSFAQFERELCSERIRDKIAAAKRKGRYVGGRPILGYDVDGERMRLVINPQEADLVRRIFQRFIQLGSCMLVARELNREGHHTKAWTARNGNKHGGALWNKAYVRRPSDEPPRRAIARPVETARSIDRLSLFPLRHRHIHVPAQLFRRRALARTLTLSWVL